MWMMRDLSILGRTQFVNTTHERASWLAKLRVRRRERVVVELGCPHLCRESLVRGLLVQCIDSYLDPRAQ